ncbi:MAG: trypsin-like peptidase domain-containing protein [Opitutales bacterium]|jgi:serine protease Do|nr:trypsin-like peptidase domain-containing protein [Opitutales bacterium]MDP4659539.1 trypsin-like peptidase domain-containing protein [Opitutales bacterium]MDP4775842.1 trypsin-like peptidase domain-containing protein [Opitutales bacterium]MDP4787803.1 trypsin-like peptidase domain-containing protein [Opitutales bacterium]MDP4861447.1 trypsin-like peptidase domain-containing protein [Opitutales bacterium]
MLRHLTALVLLPAMALAGVTFETDPRPVNRTAPGASYADMLARITPAVVSVRTAEVIPQSVLNRYRGRIDPDKVMQDAQTGETLLPTGLGSGTIIHPDGYVITNRHVVLQDNRRSVAKTVIVQLADRREFRAKVLGVDAGTDIAVLKIEGKGLPYARFADSDKARVGDVVFAIGNPLDAGLTVTSGIVSALGRSGKLGMGMAFEDFIQTDAAINPGNSGGPLIDFEGRLLGMNTAIKSGTGLSVGLGYSIPSNLITAVALDLANQGRVVRGLIGVQGEDLSVAEATKLSLGQTGGVRLVLVSDELPAAKAGLKVGDIVVGLNGKPVENWNEMRLEISRRRPGEALTLNYIREGRGALARLTVAERPLDR